MVYSDKNLPEHRLRKELGLVYRERVIDFHQDQDEENCLTEAQQRAINKGAVINCELPPITVYGAPLSPIWSPINKIGSSQRYY